MGRMLSGLAVAAGFGLLLAGCSPAQWSEIWRELRAPARTLETVGQVDLTRYQGHWHAVASFPAWFEEGCACTTADYALRSDGTVAVTNSCFRGGQPVSVSGTAWPQVPGDNSRLWVRFRWPFKGDYFILALTDDYSAALVGTPSRNYLWLLSRTPKMPPETYDAFVALAADRGFDTARLRPVPLCP